MNKILVRTAVVLIGVFLLLVVYVFASAIGPSGRSLFGSLKTAKGIVTDIPDGGSSMDIGLTIDSGLRCYINRGKEEGINVSDLQRLVYHKEVTVTYVSLWTPFDPFNTHPSYHISELTYSDSIIYSQLITSPDDYLAGR